VRRVCGGILAKKLKVPVIARRGLDVDVMLLWLLDDNANLLIWKQLHFDDAALRVLGSLILSAR
jgi:hypothetical protein